MIREIYKAIATKPPAVDFTRLRKACDKTDEIHDGPTLKAIAEKARKIREEDTREIEHITGGAH